MQWRDDGALAVDERQGRDSPMVLMKQYGRDNLYLNEDGSLTARPEYAVDWYKGSMKQVRTANNEARFVPKNASSANLLRILLLLAINWGVLLTAGAVFEALESGTETRARAASFAELDAARAQVAALVLSSSANNSYADLNATQLAVLQRFADAVAAEPAANPTWSFWHAVYYAITIATTIGYGVVAPVTTGGRVFTIFFAVFSVALLGYTLAVVSDVFNSIVKNLNRAVDLPYFSEESENTIFFVVLLSVYMFGTAGLVYGTYDQGWTFFEAFYFNFISYSTIGFGDYYLIGETATSGFVMLQALVLIIGLAILAALIGAVTDFIQRAQPGLGLLRYIKRTFYPNQDTVARPEPPGADRNVQAPRHNAPRTPQRQQRESSSKARLPPLSPEQTRRLALKQRALEHDLALASSPQPTAAGTRQIPTSPLDAHVSVTSVAASPHPRGPKLEALYGKSGVGSRMYDDNAAEAAAEAAMLQTPPRVSHGLGGGSPIAFPGGGLLGSPRGRIAPIATEPPTQDRNRGSSGWTGVGL